MKLISGHSLPRGWSLGVTRGEQQDHLGDPLPKVLEEPPKGRGFGCVVVPGMSNLPGRWHSDLVVGR